MTQVPGRISVPLDPVQTSTIESSTKGRKKGHSFCETKFGDASLSSSPSVSSRDIDPTDIHVPSPALKKYSTYLMTSSSPAVSSDEAEVERDNGFIVVGSPPAENNIPPVNPFDDKSSKERTESIGSDLFSDNADEHETLQQQNSDVVAPSKDTQSELEEKEEEQAVLPEPKERSESCDKGDFSGREDKDYLTSTPKNVVYRSKISPTKSKDNDVIMWVITDDKR